MVAKREFSPGFRLSSLDVLILVTGAVGVASLATRIPWLSFAAAFVVAHFFLFCNVIRMARPLELVWSAVLLVFAIGTIAIGVPGWIATMLGSLAVTVAVCTIEMKKPSYHGVAWQRINPRLPEWWAARHSKAHPAITAEKVTSETDK